MLKCYACYGRGLIAHKDGSDTICADCNGKGKLPCPNCQSRGLIKCQTCHGTGSLLTSSLAIVRWKTLSKGKASATKGAEGFQLCNTQAYQCTPAYFADSYFLNKFSSDVISLRAQVPTPDVVVCERHTISVVPVTRVTMEDRGKAFNFYIINQMGNFFCKTLLFVAVVGVLFIRKNDDVDKLKKLFDETTLYDKQWQAAWKDGDDSNK